MRTNQMSTGHDDNPNVLPGTVLPGRTHDSDVDAVPLSADGRVARRQRNRERVVEAYVQLLSEGVANPSADEVGERAHVTSRSVYRHLHEDPTLKSDVAQRILAPFHTVPPTDAFDQSSLADRIDAFVTFRLDLHDRTAPTMHALRGHLGSDPAVIDAIDAAQLVLRQHLMNVFARELARLPPERRETDMFAVHTLLRCESLDYLHQHLAATEAGAVLSRHLHAVLRPDHVSAFPSPTCSTRPETATASAT